MDQTEKTRQTDRHRDTQDRTIRQLSTRANGKDLHYKTETIRQTDTHRDGQDRQTRQTDKINIKTHIETDRQDTHPDARDRQTRKTSRHTSGLA